MIRVGFPSGLISVISLISPSDPATSDPSRKKLQERPRTTCLDNCVLLIGLARVLALAGREKIHLTATRCKRPRVLAADAKQDQLSHVTKIEANTSTIRPAVFPYLVPNQI